MSGKPFKLRQQQQRRHAEILRVTAKQLSAKFIGGQPLVAPNETNSDALERLLNAAVTERAKYQHIGQHNEDNDDEEGA